MKAAHEHVCPTCTLVGQLTAPIIGDPTRDITWDFYLCQRKDPPSRELIARHGSRDRDFRASEAPLARLAGDTTAWPMNVAAQLVLARRTATP